MEPSLLGQWQSSLAATEDDIRATQGLKAVPKEVEKSHPYGKWKSVGKMSKEEKVSERESFGIVVNKKKRTTDDEEEGLVSKTDMANCVLGKHPLDEAAEGEESSFKKVEFKK